MNSQISVEKENYANIAGIRSDFYHTLTNIISTLPGRKFLESIRNGRLNRFIGNCLALDDLEISRGINIIKTYIKKITWDFNTSELEDLAIDRTRLFRGHEIDGLSAPYEGQYNNQAGNCLNGNAILKVKAFYRRAGLLPDDNCHETPDYLGVQLDFMRMLCLREEEKWRTAGEIESTLCLERSFIQEHMNQWVPHYCNQAEKIAKIDFYRGFIILIRAIIKMETVYLDELQSAVGDDQAVR